MVNLVEGTMERRTILKLATAGILPSVSGHVQLGNAANEYRPECFSVEQFEFLDALAEVIIPADDHSPGAQRAHVARFIDVVVADSSDAIRKRWLAGIKAVSEISASRFHQGFVRCDSAQRDEIVADLAEREDSPQTDAERFFVLMKRATIDGYYISRVGIHDDLGYKGNTALDEFLGCQHEHHQPVDAA